MSDLVEQAKQLVRENERRELSIAEERDPAEVIENWDFYVNWAKGHIVPQEDDGDSEPLAVDFACEDCDFVGKNARSLASHRRVHG